jgi:hypothetical protein
MAPGPAKRGALALVAVLACVVALPSPALALPPPNDLFAAGQALSGSTAAANGTNVEATKEVGEPNHAGNPGGRSIWYRWTAPSTGVAIVNTSGSSFDTTLAVYTGASVGGLHHVASNDDAYGVTSSVRFTAAAGQEYRIAVDGYYGSSGAVTLNVAHSTPPPNDQLADAIVLTGTSASATGSNVGATREPGEPYHGSYYGTASVWWTWTAPSDGGVTISTAGSSFDTALAAYTGDTVSGLIRVAANDNVGYGLQSAVTFRAIAGTTYRIAVEGGGYYGSAEGSIALSLELRPPPPNDAFAAATALASAANVTATGHNVGASAEPAEPSHSLYEPPASSVWYSWTAPADGSLTLRADGDFHRALAVYTGTQVSGLTRVPTQAQEYYGGREQIRVRVAAGVTYRIALDGLWGTVGTFNLTLTLIDRPPNDDFADAEVLTGLSDETTGTNVGATQEPGEPVHEENYYDPSVWYRWTAPADGGVTVDTAGSDFAAIVAVYTGPAVDSLSRVATTRTGTGPEKRYFRAAAGVTYHVAIDGRHAEQGAIQLELDEIPPPANDMFAAAEPLVPGASAVSGNTLGATGEPGEPDAGGTAGATVWYQYTPTESGRATVELAPVDFASTVTVYTGESVDALTYVEGGSDRVSWRALPGTTYSIAVGGGPRPNRGHFAAKLTTAPRPPNDDFADAAELTGASATGSGTNDGATREPGEPNHHYGYGRRSVWWEWTAPSDGRARISLTGSFDWVAAVYTGSSVDALTLVRSADYGPLEFSASAGTTYRIAVDSYYGGDATYASGSIELSLSLVDGPANDYFADATVLEGSADDVTGTNANATVEYYEPGHAGSSAQRSIWYRWRAPATGPVTIDTAGSAIDTRLGVYTGGSIYDLVAVASNDDADGSTRARVTFEATGGVVYRIAVDSGAADTGAVALSLRHGTPPANDAFAAPQDLDGTDLAVDGSNAFATPEPGEPRHAGNEGGASVWYRWTAPSDGTLRLSTAGSSFDTLLAVYTGDAVGALVQLAANDDAGGPSSALEAPVTAGTTYGIAVDGANDRHGPRQGAVRLDLELVAVGSGGGDTGGTGGDGGTGDTGETGGTGGDTGETGGDTGETGGDTGDTGGDTGETGGDTGGTGGDTGGTGGDTGDTGETGGGTGGDTGDTGGDTGGGTGDTGGDTGDAGHTAVTASGAGEAAGTSTAADPAPAPAAPPPAATAPAPAPAAPLTVTATVQPQRLAAVLRRGLAGTASCSAACGFEVTVAVASGGGTRARQAAAARTAVTARAAGARTPFVVRLPAATRRLLRRATPARLTVRITARHEEQTATATRQVTLRR